MCVQVNGELQPLMETRGGVDLTWWMGQNDELNFKIPYLGCLQKKM